MGNMSGIEIYGVMDGIVEHLVEVTETLRTSNPQQQIPYSGVLHDLELLRKKYSEGIDEEWNLISGGQI